MPSWLLFGLYGLVLVLHWLMLDVLLALAWHLATAKDDTALQRRVAGGLPLFFLLTLALGSVALGHVRPAYGTEFYAPSVFMAWPWRVALVGLVAGLLAAYACDARARRDLATPALLRALPFASLLVFAFVLTSHVALFEAPAVLAALPEEGWLTSLWQAGAVARFGHHVLAAVALGSAWLVHLGARRLAADPAGGAVLLKRGALACMIATTLAVLFGVWHLLDAPKDVAGAVPGILLTFGIVAGLAVPTVLALAWKRASPGYARLGLWLAVATVVFKSTLRLVVRDGRLAAADALPQFDGAAQAGTQFHMFGGIVALLAAALYAWRRLRLGRRDG